MQLAACAARQVVALIVNPVNSAAWPHLISKFECSDFPSWDGTIRAERNSSAKVVPAMAELYKKKGLDPKKIVGAGASAKKAALQTSPSQSCTKVTTLDGVRANKFVAEITGEDPTNIEVAPAVYDALICAQALRTLSLAAGAGDWRTCRCINLR